MTPTPLTGTDPADAVWRAFATDPHDPTVRARLAAILQQAPRSVEPSHEAVLRVLLDDPLIDPQTIVASGWALLATAGRIPAEPEAAAGWLERDDFARALLVAGFITDLAAERPLTALRRWLLLSGRAEHFPAALDALIAQADHNGGAWPFDEAERAALAAAPGAPIVRAYLPPQPAPIDTPAYDTSLTRSVAAHYIERPYPVWRRITAPYPTTVPKAVARLGPGAPGELPEAADILIAGCGTGKEAVHWASRFPDARVAAIDISPASLAFAAERAAAMGLANLTFCRCDLHDVATLGMSFDAVVCSGVLHHLADPEAGWAALVEVLKPGGVMALMVYSARARLNIQRAHFLIADLRALPLTDDVLRAARRRLIDAMPAISGSIDFHTLAGVHDLLFHEHEDPFDINRIMAGIDRFGLTFLGFRLGPVRRARYRHEHPDDPHFRDIAAWRAIDRERPHPVRGQHNWWCAKPR